MSSPRMKLVRNVIWTAMLAVAFTGMNGNVWAQGQAQKQANTQDDDDIEEHVLNADKRLWNSILGPLLGTNPGADIKYNERSPLVVPQGRDLPVPGKAVRSGDWPIEPEIKEKRALAAARKAGKDPAAIDPAKPISGTSDSKKTGYNGAWIDDPVRKPEEPGFFSMLMDGKLNGSWAAEAGKFEGEPPRTSLIDPPAGYLTPSPVAPYGATPRADEIERKEPKL